MSQEIANIFKAYDIRGLVDLEITPDFTFATGVAYARFLQQQREPGTVIIVKICGHLQFHLRMHSLLELLL